MKVVHVITDLAIGGAETALCRLLEHSGQNGGGVTHSVVSLMKGGALQDRIRAAGFEVEEFDLAPATVPLSRIFRLRASIRGHRPDIIQGWMYHGNMAATIAKYLQLRSSRLIWGIRYSPGVLDAEKSTTRLLIRLEAPLSRLPSAIVYCSLASAHWHESLGYQAAKTVHIPNGYDTREFRPDPEAKPQLAAEIGVDQTMPVVGVVARFHAQKDHRNIIAAAALTSKRFSDVRFVFVGRNVDPSNRALMEMVHAFGLEKRVSLLGERRAINKIMAGFDVLCSGSAWGEAFPNVVAEAMASGVPCVVTDVGDSALIVGETGVVAPPRDPEALAGGLGQLIELGSEGRRHLGQAARRRIVEHFSIAAVVEQYEALYRRVARVR